MNEGRCFIAIDMKSFYASVECVARGLDPLRANLLVADESRSDQTICLAVSPALKAIGVPGRPRLFEAKRVIADYERLHPKHSNTVEVTYFSCLEDPNLQEAKGSYLTYRGILKIINDFSRMLILNDDTKIPIDEIISINSPVFDSLMDILNRAE